MTDYEILSHFGNRLRTLREHRGISADDIALQLGLTPDAVRKYERGMRDPGIIRLVQAKELLKCGWMTLLDGIDDDKIEYREYNVLSSTSSNILKHLATEWTGDIEALVIFMGMLSSFPPSVRREFYISADIMKDKLLKSGVITEEDLPEGIEYMESQIGKLYEQG